MSTSTNTQYFDTLRAIALLGVIIIHISSPLVNMTYDDNMPYWWIGNVVDSAVRFAVPLFLMLSGATMLGKDYSLSEFYKKRMLRVFVPFLFWLAVYWIYRWVMLKPAEQPHEYQAIFNWGGKLFLKEGVSKHFWYVYMILSIYLILPFLGRGLRKINLTITANILLIWVILTFACKTIPQNMYSWSGDFGSKALGYFLHAGYLVLGYYLSRMAVTAPRIRSLAATIFVFSVAVSSITTYFLSRNAQRLDLSMYSYLSINTIIQSIAIFIWIKDSKSKNKYVNVIRKTLSNYSYGIYLVHIMVIGILFRNGIYWSFAHPLVSLPLLTVLVTACSFGIIFVLRKLPAGKYVAG